MTRSLLLIGTVICALAAPEVRAAKPKPAAAAEAHKRKGKQLFNQGRFDESIVEYQAAHALVPDPKYLFNIALAYHRQGKKPQALEYFKRYLTDDPTGAGAAEAREHVATLTREIAEAEAAPPPAAPAQTLPAADPPAPSPPSPSPPVAAADPPSDPPAPATTTTAAATVERATPIVSAFGPKLGIHVSTIDDPDIDSDFRVGVVAGGFVTFAPTDWLGIELELLYVQKGSHPSDETPLTLHYLEIPLLLRPSYRGWFVEAGPYVSFLLHGDTAFNDQLKSVDLGLIFGAGYGLSLGDGTLIFEARYELGLPSIKVDQPPKNRTISIALGYSFR